MTGFIGLKLFAICQPCLTHIHLQMDNTAAVYYLNKIGDTVSFELMYASPKYVGMVRGKKHSSIKILQFFDKFVQPTGF